MIDTPQTRIAAKRRLEEFLTDEAVVGALERLERKYIGEFKTGKKAEDLFRAQARMNAIDELTNELLVVKAAGEVEEITQAKVDKKGQQFPQLQK